MFDLKSKHAFGSEADIDIALEQGLIDAYDILYLDEKKIGWIDRDGNKVIVDNSVSAEIGESIAKNAGDISELKEHASTTNEEITSLKEQMSTATENISDMNEKISSVEEDIVKLNEDMQNAGAVASVNGQTGEVELSYDDLKDKPFCDSPTGGDTITWDGNTEGLWTRSMSDVAYARITEQALSIDDFKNGCSVVVETENGLETIEVPFEYTVEDGGFIYHIANSNTENMYIVLATKDYYAYEDYLWKAGLIVREDVRSVTIHGYEGFPVFKQLDEKFIPKSIHTWESLPDKPFYEGDPIEVEFVPLADYLPYNVDEAGIFINLSENKELIEGDDYIVNVNGQTYRYTAKRFILDEFGIDWIYIGCNLVADGPQFSADSPFYIHIIEEEGVKYINCGLAVEFFPDVTSETPVQIGITHIEQYIKKIDEKFIPDTIGVSWKNVKDKPFYAEVVEENVIPLGEYQFISRNLPPDYFEPEIALSIPDFQLEDGLVYGVTIQGKTYVCPAGYNSSYDVIVWPYGVDDNPPLTIRNRIDGGCTVKLAYAEFPDFIASGEETIEVPIQFGMTIVTENVTMLDKKYIPSNVLIIELKSVPDNAQGFPPDAFTTIEQAVSEGKLVYAVNAMGNTCYEFKGWDYLDDGTRYADFVQARVYLPSMNISYKQLRLTEGDEDNLVSARGYHGAIPPAVTTSDNGSILQVVDGVWTAQPLSTSEHTWASLPDKPFGETVQIPHALNVESMDGLESFTTTHTYEGVNEEVTFYKVADIVPEPSAIDWTNSYYGVDMSQEGTDCWYTYPDGTPALIVARATEISAVPYSNNEVFSVPSAGIWTSAADYVNGLVCTVEEVTKLSDEFIPDSIARKEDIPDAFEASVQSVNGKTGAVELSYDDLKDKPFSEGEYAEIVPTNRYYPSMVMDGNLDFSGLSNKAVLVVGDEYEVIINGQTYTCVAESYSDENGEHITIGDSDSLFEITYHYNRIDCNISGELIPDADENTSVQISVTQVIERFKAIDEKFIPDTIARVSDIPEVPEHTWESLPDKPFGEEEATVATLFEGTRSLDWYGSDFQSSGGINGGLTIELGKNYLITVNPDGFGTYTCVYDCTSTTRLSCYVTSVNDSSDGFWFEVDCGTGTIFIGISNPDDLGNISANILIEELGTVVDPLDAKYLPMSDIIEAVKRSFTDVSQEGA